jgi:hypothetical protein
VGALTRFLDDGPLCMSNNAAERELRAVATMCSLCTPLSSVYKHCKLLLWGGATRAGCSRDRDGHPVRAQVRGSNLVRCARHNLFGGKNAVLDEPSDAVAGDPSVVAASDIVSHSPFFSAER